MNSVFVKSLVSSVLLVGSIHAAFAAQTADVVVKGRLTPGTCDVTLGNGGNFDFGDTPLASLNANTGNTLPGIQTSMNITCAAAATVGFQLNDNVVGSVDTNGIGGGFAPSSAYGLGYASDGTTRLGAFFARILAMTVDGNPLLPAGVIISSDGGSTWVAGTRDCAGTHCTFRDGDIFSPGVVGTPMPYRVFSADFWVYPGLKGTASYPQGQVQHLTGDATLTLFDI